MELQGEWQRYHSSQLEKCSPELFPYIRIVRRDSFSHAELVYTVCCSEILCHSLAKLRRLAGQLQLQIIQEFSQNPLDTWASIRATLS